MNAEQSRNLAQAFLDTGKTKSLEEAFRAIEDAALKGRFCCYNYLPNVHGDFVTTVLESKGYEVIQHKHDNDPAHVSALFIKF